MKVLIVVVLLLVLMGSFLIYNSMGVSEMDNEVTEGVYQGPVRPTDDEAYFRKTGITKPLEIKE